MNIVLKVNKEVQDKMIKYYSDKKRDKEIPYVILQADDNDTVITMYTSGKVMFQGVSADVDAMMWQEMMGVSKEEVAKQEKLKEMYINCSSVGSDEVGTGDYFGPIVVSATFVDKKSQQLLIDLGVRDSKKLTDEKIIEIAPEIIKNIPHVTFTFTPKDYNKFGITNMNKIKAILHNKALYILKSRTSNYQKIVVDQFCPPNKFYEHINNVPTKVTNITFTTHAEDKCLSVAAASIISRFIFLKEMKRLNQELNELVPLGAGDAVDKFGCKIVEKYGISKLNDIAKLNFKNTDKIKESLNIK